MAAEMIDAGIDVHDIYRRLYEGVPQGKLELLARGLSNVRRYDGGLLTLTHLTREDYASTGRRRELLRGRRRPSALGRGHGGRGARARPALRRGATTRRKVSLRATDDRVDVSLHRARGRRRRAPPGRRLLHRPRDLRARGLPARAGRRPALSPVRRSPTGSCSSTSRRGRRRTTSWRGVRRRLGRGVKVGHAGTLDPFATGLLLVLVGRATRVQRFLMALPKRYATVARLGWTSTTGDRDGELAPGRTPAEPLALPTGVLRQRPPAYSAVKVGGERAYARARRGEAVELPEREVAVTRFECVWRDGDRAGLRDRVLLGDLRALAGDRTSATRTASSCGAPASARSTSPTPIRSGSCRSTTRSASCPRSSSPATTRAGRATASPCPARRRRAPSCGCCDADGLIALAEPRDGRRPEADRGLSGLRLTFRRDAGHLAPRRHAAPAPRRRGRVRRRPPRPPRGDPRRRHGADLRAASAGGGRAGQRAEAADLAGGQGRPDRRARACASWS